MNDARLVRSELERVGYVVELVENADRASLLASLQRFGERTRVAPPDARIIVYFAGHGVRVGTHQMLIPVGVRIPAVFRDTTLPMPEREAAHSVRAFAVSYGEIGQALGKRSGSGFNLIVLDVCGNNPWRTYPKYYNNLTREEVFEAFADHAELPSNSVMLLSAGGSPASDGVGMNSPTAEAFRDILRNDPGVSLYNFVFRLQGRVDIKTEGRQTPRFYDTFRDPFYESVVCVAC